MRRGSLAALAVLALSACAPQVSSDITTPGTPLTYGWVMEHHGLDWWVQIGTKVDGSGVHVAVQGWVTATGYDYFAEFDAVAPGSTHHYEIKWNGTGWECYFDGQLRATLNIGNPTTAKPEVNYGEKTAV